MGQVSSKKNEGKYAKEYNQNDRNNNKEQTRINKNLTKYEKNETYLTISVIDAHKFIEGRRFCIAKDVTYTFPNDNQEASRFNESIKLMKQLFNSNYSAPVEKLLSHGAKVLEIGTGGGFWLADMSKTFPMSIFLGLDISTTFHQECLPENCAFLEYNYFEEIPFPENTFDYVFQQSISSSKFRDNQLDIHLREIFRVVKPGGWIEIFGTPTEIINAGPASKEFIKLVRKCYQFNGLDPSIVHAYPNKLRSLNIKKVQVVETQYYLSHHNTISENKESSLLLATAESLRVMIKMAVGYTDEEYDAILRGMAIEQKTLNMSVRCIRIFGQKESNFT
ncbi:S-adenosyl-L-methionine-dependent methyltransferase [Gigaspora margarita]|uniref:S-adenosyl-L-methionine-dependent methyltransferase n=1 Tax=Gigaspora margarita TaxID=4874 RepID=A0A8H4A8A4_GIGMA|nr:S-adenosyl-L-methionine-dependent methyltransferase [Gigaspora margarita]